jgi:hypothetical protein
VFAGGEPHCAVLLSAYGAGGAADALDRVVVTAAPAGASGEGRPAVGGWSALECAEAVGGRIEVEDVQRLTAEVGCSEGKHVYAVMAPCEWFGHYVQQLLG